MFTESSLKKLLATNSDLAGVNENCTASHLNDKISRVLGQSGRKYHNKVTEYNGRSFDSAKEALRAKELDLLQKVGEIFCLNFQVPIPVAEKIKWIADFVYLDKNLNPVFEDVKGMKTQVYRLKRKLFKEKYGKEIKDD